MLDTLLLQTFVTVVDEDGFSRAAKKLHLTQSAVSGHVRRLEEQIGKPLMTRTTRAQQLTPDGERLLSYARTILALNRDAWAEMTRTPFHGRLRIGVSEDFVESRLLRTFQAFAAQYPGMEIDVQVGIPGTLLALMKQGHLELVIGSLCESSEAGTLLWQEPLVWAWSGQSLTPLPTPLPLALFPEPCPYREVALRRLAESGIAQRTVMACSSTAALQAAALAGFAVAPMPLGMLRPGMAVLGVEQGLPELPHAQFRLFVSAEVDQGIVAAVSQLVVEYCSVRRG